MAYNNGGSGSRPPISHPYPPSYHTTSPSRSQPQIAYPGYSAPSQSSYGGGYTSQQLPSNHPFNAGPDSYAYDPQPPQQGVPPSQSQGQSRPIRGRTYSDVPLTAAPGGPTGGSSVYPKGEYPEGWTKEDELAEQEFLAQGMFNWNEMRSWRYWIRKEWWLYYLIFIVISVLVILMVLYHDQIVNWLKPVATWMKNLPAGWLIPIAVLFVISFPPLFGHEIVAVLCGVVWGLWVGFGIVAAGTFIGEVGNFYAFKYCLRSHAEKLEKKNTNYATLAHVVREGGFFIIFVVRLSAIPGHFTTAVFATCGMNIWIFMLAALLTLPKQLITVYLGVILEASGTGTKTTKDRIISDTVLAVGFLITIAAAWYIYRQMNKARVAVWRKQRMQLASRGVSLDPVTNRMTFAGSKNDLEAGEDDAASPMLPPSGSNYNESYQTPYDPREENRYDESDIGQRQNYSNYAASSSPRPGVIDFSQPQQSQGYSSQSQQQAYFPQAHPTSSGSGVHRSQTSATAYSTGPLSPTGQASFPVPAPAHQGSGYSGYNAQGGGYGQR